MDLRFAELVISSETASPVSSRTGSPRITEADRPWLPPTEFSGNAEVRPFALATDWSQPGAAMDSEHQMILQKVLEIDTKMSDVSFERAARNAEKLPGTVALRGRALLHLVSCFRIDHAVSQDYFKRTIDAVIGMADVALSHRVSEALVEKFHVWFAVGNNLPFFDAQQVFSSMRKVVQDVQNALPQGTGSFRAVDRIADFLCREDGLQPDHLATECIEMLSMCEHAVGSLADVWDERYVGYLPHLMKYCPDAARAVARVEQQLPRLPPEKRPLVTSRLDAFERRIFECERWTKPALNEAQSSVVASSETAPIFTTPVDVFALINDSAVTGQRLGFEGLRGERVFLAVHDTIDFPDIAPADVLSMRLTARAASFILHKQHIAAAIAFDNIDRTVMYRIERSSKLKETGPMTHGIDEAMARVCRLDSTTLTLNDADLQVYHCMSPAYHPEGRDTRKMQQQTQIVSIEHWDDERNFVAEGPHTLRTQSLHRLVNRLRGMSPEESTSSARQFAWSLFFGALRGLELNSRPSVLGHLLKAAVTADEVQGCMREFEHILEQDPTNFTLHIRLVRSLAVHGMNSFGRDRFPALSRLTRVLNGLPDHVLASHADAIDIVARAHPWGGEETWVAQTRALQADAYDQIVAAYRSAPVPSPGAVRSVAPAAELAKQGVHPLVDALWIFEENSANLNGAFDDIAALIARMDVVPRLRSLFALFNEHGGRLAPGHNAESKIDEAFTSLRHDVLQNTQAHGTYGRENVDAVLSLLLGADNELIKQTRAYWEDCLKDLYLYANNGS